jgi:SecD/SecF fusion protein
MQRESNWRLWLTGIVTVLCVLFIWPTGRYMYFALNSRPPTEADYASAETYAEALKTYESKRGDLQREAIGLGLDLIGGVDVLLKIDEAKMRENALDLQREQLVSRFSQQMIDAVVRLDGRKDRLVLSLNDKANAQQAANILQDSVKSDALASFDENGLKRDGQTELELNQTRFQDEIEKALRTAEKVIRQRVDQFGVVQPSVSLQIADRSIRVQVPGERDPERVIREVIRPAQLEFYLLHEDNDALAAERFERVEYINPRKEKRYEFRLKPGETLPTGHRMMPGVSVKWNEGKGQLDTIDEVYVVKSAPEMTGKNLVEAGVRTDPTDFTSPVKVTLAFDFEGAREFRNITKKHLGKRLAIALDGVIHSAPVLKEVIASGQAEISGSFSRQEAHDLSLVLKAGALPADLRAEEKRAVGPTLGAESIVESARALLISGLFTAVFMALYYGAAGVISILALLLNMLVIVACLDMFNATLTLSGIGGMILTIGMAVDANVLIYERMREELAAGREFGAAMRAGFARAFSVIFDSNLTTLLTAVALLQFGTGSVQGFALTMAFGLLANLFTGLTVTYALCRLWFSLRGKMGLGVIRIFPNPKYDFLAMRRFTFPLSGLMLVGLTGYLIWIGGPPQAVDFTGGVLSELRLTGAPAKEDLTKPIREALIGAGLPGEQARVQKVRSAEHNDYLVRLALQVNPERPENRSGEVEYTQKRLEETLKAKFAETVDFLGTTAVGEEVGQGLRQIAMLVVVAGSISILIYLWFRFELVFGVAAVIALIHDLAITLGVVTLCGVQTSLDIVSALMILLGFSVNDTIVIFDRVREDSRLMLGKPFGEICNAAMNQSLSRTLITNGTVLVVMVVMYLFGGRSLQPFALTMIVGGVVGTYSSDFLATPIVYLWNRRQQGRLVEHLGRRPAPAAGAAATATSLASAPSAGGAKGPGSSVGAQPPRRRGRR